MKTARATKPANQRVAVRMSRVRRACLLKKREGGFGLEVRVWERGGLRMRSVDGISVVDGGMEGWGGRWGLGERVRTYREGGGGSKRRRRGRREIRWGRWKDGYVRGTRMLLFRKSVCFYVLCAGLAPLGDGLTVTVQTERNDGEEALDCTKGGIEVEHICCVRICTVMYCCSCIRDLKVFVCMALWRSCDG